MKKNLLTITMLILTGCQQADNPSQAAVEVKDNIVKQCSIYDSRDWQATVLPSTEIKNSYTLTVTGEVDLPSPAYNINWVQGPVDRMNPPSLRLRLTTENLSEGAAIQVITATKIKYQLDTPMDMFGSVIISCDDATIATIPVKTSM